MPWTELAPSAQTWEPSSHSGAASVASRLNRVYPQTDSAITDVNFVHRVQSFGPWFVATGNGVLIKSTITVGV